MVILLIIIICQCYHHYYRNRCTKFFKQGVSHKKKKIEKQVIFLTSCLYRHDHFKMGDFGTLHYNQCIITSTSTIITSRG